ncbi:FAD-binding protein, partial [Oscillochloris sp. ZM17-4]|uniref:FAD-binding oxidoreductase n=1 Tax=Oscillochloris sp. ZM17-4 TaxID=2866714 RepID=UPI001C733F1D
MTTHTEIIAVQPGALMATAPAGATIEQMSAALAGHGLWLPICPLTPGLRLADLVAHNAGGRRRLAHGPIGRYLRAATLGDGLRLGGPTIKRSTGLGLHRAIAGGAIDLGQPRDLTLSLRPLPAARAALSLRCADLGAACRLAAGLLRRGLALSALALAEGESGAGLLLAELEGAPAVVERQAAELIAAARAAGAAAAPADESAWARWESLAAAQLAAQLAVELTLPRAALPAAIAAARATARRHGRGLAIWGDAGVGALCLRLAGPPDAAGQRCLAELVGLGRAAGGDLSTELGRGVRAHFPATHAVSYQASAKRSPDTTPLFDSLRAIVGPRYLLTRPDDLGAYAIDASIARPEGPPLAVALPASAAELAALMRVAAAHGLPVVSRGAGSGLAGGAIPSPGALLVGLNRMGQIAIDRAQMVAHVGAGATTAEVQRAAEAVGLFYPPDPSSQSTSTIGGNIACNAGGPRCVKYGVTADYVLGLTVALADGRMARWGDGLAGQGPESGLAQLLVGSEGTLAVIAEATLRLLPLPAARRTAMAIFPTLDAACETVEQIMAAGVVPAALELMDDTTIAAVEAYLQIGLPRDAGAMLLMLADGEPEAVAADSLALAELARRGGAVRVQVARGAAEEADLWRGRRAIAPALARIRPSRLGEDISVPLPQIAACVRRIKQISAEHGLPIVVFGHAGDGNLHPNILFDPRDPAEAARLWPCAEAIFAAALELGGTLSGEHGVGTLKRPFMRRAIGEPAIDIQRQIKAWLDPDGRLNPGKVLP